MDGLLFLNGTPPAKGLLKKLDFLAHIVVCADGAYDYLSEFCTPDILVGDFDSIKKRGNPTEKESDIIPKNCGVLPQSANFSPQSDDFSPQSANFSPQSDDFLRGLRAKKIVKLPAEKDFTDGHIAMLEMIKAGADRIFIFGAVGGQPDHQLSNYSLLYLAAKNKKQAVIVTEKFKIYYAEGDFCCKIKTGKRVSVVPFSDKAHILNTKGLKYSVCDEVFDRLHIKGISNVAVADTVELNLKKGAALVFAEI